MYTVAEGDAISPLVVGAPGGEGKDKHESKKTLDDVPLPPLTPQPFSQRRAGTQL